MGSVTAQHDPSTVTAPDEDWNAPPYNSDDFRMYSLKVELCQKTYQHNIAACPYAHHGERAVRRDVRVHSYEAVVCQELLQKGKCPREDNCKAAHSVFEYWLHPSRYRTQLCREGSSCTRKVCFFAHTLAELRATPASADDGSNSGPVDPFSCGGKYSLAALNKKQQADGGQSTAGSKGNNAAAAGQQQPAASAASTRPRRNSADNSNAAAKPQGQSRSRRSSGEAAAPSAAAAAAWSHSAAMACPTSAGGMASGACGVLPPRTSFNIQATSNINGLPLQAPMQPAQQPVLLPVMAGELHAAHCGNSIASLPSQLNAYSNSSIGSLSVGSSSCSSNSLSPQLLQQVSLDSCFGVGSPATTTPASQQLLLLLGNQAAACSSPTALQQSSSNLAEQLLGCSEPLPWACDLSPPQAAGQLRTLSHQQQMLQVLLPAATDAGLGGGGSPVAHQMGAAACSPQLLSNALSALSMGSPGAAPALPGASCAPACQQQLVQLMMLPDAAANQPLQHQRYVVVPQASPSSYGAQASAMGACMLQCTPCLPLNASLLHDTSCAASSSRLGAGIMGQQMMPSLSAGFVSLPSAGMYEEQRSLMACSTPQMAVTAWM